MDPSSHIIEKVFLEIGTSNLETAQNIKNNIDLFLKDELFPRLESLFGEYNLDDDIIRFNKFDINLSVEKWGNSEEIKTKLINQFEQRLAVEFMSIPKFEVVNSGETQVHRLSKKSNSGNILLFFLEKGYLPWYGTKEKIDDLTKPENWKIILENSQFLRSLNELTRNNETVIDRFIYQFDDEILLAFLACINQQISDELNSVIKICSHLNSETRHLILKLLFLISESREPVIEKKTEALFSKLLDFERDENIDKHLLYKVKNLILKILSPSFLPGYLLFDENRKPGVEITEVESPDFRDLKTGDTFAADQSGNKIIELLENALIQDIDKNSSPEILAKPIIGNEMKNMMEIDGDFVIEQPQSATIQKGEEFLFFDKGDAEITFQNAGLILLHPFLKHFFREINLINERGELVYPDVAVQALHYLATGDEFVFEGNLVFEKFLSGVPLQTPIQKQSLLTDLIKDEAYNLLNEVIKNWSALKNTSPDGLRQMYLQRKGKLIQTENSFKLIVERRAQDVLLEKISWNISIIKLPWMNEVVYVEW